MVYPDTGAGVLGITLIILGGWFSVGSKLIILTLKKQRSNDGPFRRSITAKLNLEFIIKEVI